MAFWSACSTCRTSWPRDWCSVGVAQIELVVFDVDGVLSDGQLYFGPNGQESKAFNARDGVGIKYLMRSGLEVAFLSGRESAPVGARAANLGVKHVITGAKNKGPAFLELLESLGLEASRAAFMGDDLMDLPAMRLAGWSACPSDAVDLVREAADFVASVPGGHGAAREVAEHILREQGKWQAILERYLPE